jgi:hypothetical protein
MLGLDVEGTRSTITIPQGAEGNDRPLTIVSEEWRSPVLGFDLLSISDDPRFGRSTREVKEVNQGEPDATLFQPPKWYTVKDQTTQH